jgi:hypothetical protein
MSEANKGTKLVITTRSQATGQITDLATAQVRPPQQAHDLGSCR